MDLDLEGRHALVCGASQGIGRAIAVELAQLGASVTALSRTAEALQTLVGELPRPHAAQSHDFIALDMLETEALRGKLETLTAAHPVHILINNSGGPPPGPAGDADPEAYLRAFRQHLVAGQVLQQAVTPGMRAAGFGRIVNVISTSVKEPIPNLGVSNTVRAAVAGWAKTLSVELAADGITVNNVLPGFTRTGRLDGIIAARAKQNGVSEDEAAATMRGYVPAKRFGEPQEVAAVAAFLCTPAAAYVNGVSIAVDGGRTHALA